jgi:signal transduction histidine kinase
MPSLPGSAQVPTERGDRIVHKPVPPGRSPGPPEGAGLAASFSMAWILIGMAGAGLGAGLVTYGVSRAICRRHGERIRAEAIALERERLGKDLHDHLGAELARIGAICDRALHFEANDLEVRKSLEQIHRAAGVSSRTLGELIWLTKPSNDNLSQVANYLGDMACEMVECTGIVCHLEIPSHLPEVPVSYEVRRDLLLAVREMIGNAILHSGTESVTLAVRWQADPGLMEIQVVDQGCGMRQRINRVQKRTFRGGNGIQHLRSRVQKHRGALQLVDGHPGLTVILRIPLEGFGAGG